MLEAPIPQDARQHRKGGDRHRRTHEQGPGEQAMAGQQVRKPGFKQASQTNPQDQREEHPSGGNPTGQGQAPHQQVGIELKPHQKHEQHQAQLAEQVELAAHGPVKQMGFQARRQGPQQTGAEHNAAHDFAYNPRLVTSLGQGTKQLGSDRDDRHRQHRRCQIDRGGHGDSGVRLTIGPMMPGIIMSGGY